MTRTKSSDGRTFGASRTGAADSPRPSCFGAAASNLNPETIVVALGSNVGDRQVNLRRAIEGLSCAMRVVVASSVWETAPVGCRDGDRAYLNMVVAGWTRTSPLALLSAIATLELAGGRRRLRPNEPRTIDIDILFFGNRRLSVPGLTIPHPRFKERNFVLEPLREVADTVALPAFAGDLQAYRGVGEVRRAATLY